MGQQLHGGGARFRGYRESAADGTRRLVFRELERPNEGELRFHLPEGIAHGPLELADEDRDLFFRIAERHGDVEILNAGFSWRFSGYEPIWDGYPSGPVPDTACIDTAPLLTLGETITRSRKNDEEWAPDVPDLPVAYTYIGQFIAHDISDMRIYDGGPVINLQSGGLDLSSIFGTPPSTEQNFVGPTLHLQQMRDLPRNTDGAPTIPDGRNDANLAVAQVHNMIARYYLYELDRLGDPAAAHRSAINHFQHAVLYDYLPRFVGAGLVSDVMNGPRILTGTGSFLVPLEFAAAFFRFGHAQVRDVYVDVFGSNSAATASALIEYTHAGGQITTGTGEPRLPDSWTLTWSRAIGPSAVKARSICARLATSHADVDEDVTYQPQLASAGAVNLATETLVRGARLGLPPAQILIDWIATHHPGIPPIAKIDLTDEDTLKLAARYATADLVDTIRANYATETPLWLYTLLEAQEATGGQRLGPLAGRIVAETLIAAIGADSEGIFGTSTGFQPHDGAGGFDFAVMVERAFSI